MTALQQVTGFTRKFLAICTMLLLGFLVIYFGTKIILGIKEAIYPTPPPPPSVGYGKLPPIIFPSQTPVKLTYSLNTVTGDVPDFGDRAHVHKIELPQPSLLALQNATAQMTTIGFTSTPTAVSDTNYIWTNNESLPKTMNVNIQRMDFTITSDYTTDPTVKQASSLPDQNQAISFTTTFLTNLGNYPADIDENKTKVSLFALNNNALTPATSISTAQIVRVDYFQKDIDKMPIYYSQPSYSSMNMLLASSDGINPQIVEAHFTHKPISGSSETYPIKTTKQAFKDLQDGKGYIASLPTGTNQVTIRNISLGYFISDSDQKYLMPIYVFQGDNNFFAYISAVDEKWTETP